MKTLYFLPQRLKSMFFLTFFEWQSDDKNFKKKSTFTFARFFQIWCIVPHPESGPHQQVSSVHVGHCSEQIGFVSMLKMQGIRVIKVPTAARKNDVLTNKILMKSRKILVNWMESLLWNPWARKYLATNDTTYIREIVDKNRIFLWKCHKAFYHQQWTTFQNI